MSNTKREGGGLQRPGHVPGRRLWRARRPPPIEPLGGGRWPGPEAWARGLGQRPTHGPLAWKGGPHTLASGPPPSHHYPVRSARECSFWPLGSLSCARKQPYTTPPPLKPLPSAAALAAARSDAAEAAGATSSRRASTSRAAATAGGPRGAGGAAAEAATETKQVLSLICVEGVSKLACFSWF